MKNTILASSFLAIALAAGTAAAQQGGSSGLDSANGNTWSNDVNASPGENSTGNATGLPRSGANAPVWNSGSMTSGSGTSGAYSAPSDINGYRRSTSPYSPALQRSNAAGGLPAGELSTPWQDTGGVSGSQMH